MSDEVQTTREQREAVIVALVGDHDPKLRYPAWQRWIDTGDEEPRDPTNRYDGPPPRAVRRAAGGGGSTMAPLAPCPRCRLTGRLDLHGRSTISESPADTVKCPTCRGHGVVPVAARGAAQGREDR